MTKLTHITEVIMTKDSVKIKFDNGKELDFVVCYDGVVRINSSFCNIQTTKKIALNVAEVTYTDKQ